MADFADLSVYEIAENKEMFNDVLEMWADEWMENGFDCIDCAVDYAHENIDIVIDWFIENWVK